MDEQIISDKWLPHLRTQFATARPILFTGAGFSLEVRNVRGEPLPSYEELRARIWQLCFPGTPLEPATLQDVFEHALRRNRKDLVRLLEESLTVNADTIPAWYQNLFDHPWQRYYTLNVDDMAKAVERKYQLKRTNIVISATAPKSRTVIAVDPTKELECIHLNGTLSDLPENVTFSLSQYMERLAIPDPWYLRFSGDLLTSPVVFIGTRLDEPPLWQHIALRRGRGPTDAGEFRHRSYLVTPGLDRTRQARLAEFNVEWVPMPGQEFVEKVLMRLGDSPAKGFAYLHVIGPRAGRGATTLREVSELATNPGEHNEFLMGNEPIWADLQSGRAIARSCDAATEQVVFERMKVEGPKGVLVITGTAGSGKSTSLKRASLALSTNGIRTGWLDKHSELTPYQVKAAMKAEHAPIVLAIDDADTYGTELASWAREIALTVPYPLVVLGIRSGRIDRVLNPTVVGDLPKHEIVMPPLEDADINDLVNQLEKHNRLGILTALRRDEQIRAFRDKAGRQLLVAMIEATSGRKFEEKAIGELLELEEEGQRVYSLVAVASNFRFTLSRHELLVAAQGFSNATLNTVADLVRRHIIAERNGQIMARHRTIAEIITNELAKNGQLGPPIRGLAQMAAAEAAPNLHRSDRYWRMVRMFVNHDFLHRTVGREFARNLYESLEGLLSWDYHYWLQRGSLEVEEGDLHLAEHYLNTAKALGSDDRLLDTEWAYLLFKKACHNPAANEALEWVREASQTLEALMVRIGDPYPYHVLGSQGLAWARKGLSNPQERERFLKKLINKIEEGARKYRSEKDLQKLLEDLKREYLGIAIGRAIRT